jgi:hypothetical protein
MFAMPILASATVVGVKPGPFPDGMDTWYGSNFNTSSQHDGKLLVGGWGDEYDSLVRFNLSGLPLVATEADVWLYATPAAAGGTPTGVSWYQNTTQWHTGSVGWSTRPSTNLIGFTNAPATIPGWYGVNFTSQYNAWRSGNTATPNYGLGLKPMANNNNFDQFDGSGYTANPALRPELDVIYNTSSTDSIPKLKWPLANPSYASRGTPTQSFGAFPWAGGTTCPAGAQKIHNGTDYSTGGVSGATEYAPEDGIVKEITPTTEWGSNLVMEHTSPTGSKYTTVMWHIQPNSDAIASNPGGFIPKGAPVGTIYNLALSSPPHTPHFHLGMRMAPYSSPDSGAGALPQTNCGGYLAFPASFVNVENASNVIISN